MARHHCSQTKIRCEGKLETNKEDPVYLTTAEAAHHLKMSPRRLEKLRVIGGGPIFRKHGGHVVYKRSDLDNWSDSRQRDVTKPPQIQADPEEPFPPRPTSPPLKPCPQVSM
jgi:hypothetical protein